MKIYNDISALVGHTPLVRLHHLEEIYRLSAQLVAKVEAFNPLGSAKDRVGLALIEDAEQKGLLQKGATVIEPTSGNTGVGLAFVCALKGYTLILTMPETMSLERRQLLAALGAKIELTPGAEGMSGAIRRANELHDSLPGSFIPGQFENPANPDVHRRTTAREIWDDTDGQLDYFVAGVGTGGTITGVAKGLKELGSHARIVAVEPAGSAVLEGKQPGPHGLMGIGAGFIPKNLDVSLLDEVMAITEEEAYTFGRLLSTREGILAGITSGAAVAAAVKLAKREENHGKRIVVLLPDTGERYLSTPLFAAEQ